MKFLVLFIETCFTLCLYVRVTDGLLYDPDAYRNVSEIITSKGFPLEEYTVQTVDGYLLAMQRIPHGRNNCIPKNKVVMFVHGEVGDSRTWFFNSYSLGYLLPDEGYDVWFLNNRGNSYSKKHVVYNPHERRFWNFSVDDLALYDLPAAIDFVLKKTGKDGLYIIGYSSGNAITYAMLSDLKPYNQKVKLTIALAPIAFIGHFTFPVRYLIPFKDEIAASIDAVTQGEFLPYIEIARFKAGEFCAVAKELCQSIFFYLFGEDREQLNQKRFPIYVSMYPDSSSTKRLVHYGQLYESKKFRKFDYGPEGNIEYYQQKEPPDYDVSQIETPIAWFWSTNDKVADTEDVDILRQKVNTLVFDRHIPHYNHFDYILAKNSPSQVNEHVLELLRDY